MKVASQQLAEVCAVKKLSKEEGISTSNSSLSSSKDLVTSLRKTKVEMHFCFSYVQVQLNWKHINVCTYLEVLHRLNHLPYSILNELHN